MTLYHFTAKRFIESILKAGLTKGVMVKTISPVTFIFNKQWLTKNPEFNQSWLNPNSQLKYKRNEVRLTIEIPIKQTQNCQPWSQMRFLVPLVADELSAFGDPENWFIYQGNIKPEWIIDVYQNEEIT